MADTVSTAAARAQVWAKQIWAEAEKELYFAKMMGKTEPTLDKMVQSALNSIICLKEDLLSEGQKKEGYIINLQLAYQLTGDGVTGDTSLETAEEAINTYNLAVTVQQYRNAVKDTGQYDNQKVKYDVRLMLKEMLKSWVRQKMDKLMFEALSTSPTYSATFASNRHLYGGSAANVAALDDSTADTGELFDCRIIRKAKRLAEVSVPKIRPIIVDGNEYYVCIAHPYQIRSLHESSEWKNSHYYAADRGLKNPIFTGSDSIIDGVIIHSHKNIATAASGGELSGDTASGANTATDDVARALFLGAQAGVIAMAKKPFWNEKFFEYGNEFGVASGFIAGIAKTVFNSIDYATIALDTTIETN